MRSETVAPRTDTIEFRLASATSFERLLESRPGRISEPFGLKTSEPVGGRLGQKWDGVKRNLPHEADALARCRVNEADCSAAAKRFLAIVQKAAVREGWSRIAEVNRAINLSIRPVDDATQYGVRDRWASPLMTFASAAGDCEDIAIAKYVALREIGIDDDDLRLVIVHDRMASEDHAVTAVRFEDQWLILDNKRSDIRRDLSFEAFDPLFVIDGSSVRKAERPSVAPQAPWIDARIAKPFSTGSNVVPDLA